MKRGITLLAFLLVMAGSVFGQTDHGYNLYGQFLGTSTGIGVGLDSRFRAGGILGYSLGLAFTDISWSRDDGLDGCYASYDAESRGISIPFEINAILGKRASKFEIGFGMTTYLVNRDELHYKTIFFPSEEDGVLDFERYSTRKKVFRPNIIGTINIGYRLQRKSGFFMKVGLSLLIGDLKCSPIDGVVALPNICLGYTIPHF